MRVWDLVMNSEVACLRGNQGRVTSMVFSKDLKTLIVGGQDGRVAFYNVSDNYKNFALLHACKDMKVPH